MTIRDIKILLNIINKKIDLGLPLDITVNQEFEKKTKAKNLIFSNGIDFIYEFFNLDGELKNNFLTKSLRSIGKNLSIGKIFSKIADKGFIF